MVHIIEIAIQSLIVVGLAYGAYHVMWTGRHESRKH
jgi:copper(I)-binding protein